MSIEELKKVTIFGLLSEKLETLDELQSLGSLHIIPLVVNEDLLEKKGVTKESYVALKYLLDCPQKLKVFLDRDGFDPIALEKKILESKNKAKELQDRNEVIDEKIEELKPWGNFVEYDIFPHKYWFYVIPYKEFKDIDDTYSVVSKDNQFLYVVILSENEPQNIPGKRVYLSKTPLKDLEKELDEVEFKLEDIFYERVSLTRWRALFMENLYAIENEKELSVASKKTYDEHTLFALQAWVPKNKLDSIVNYAERKNLALTVEDPKENEKPPTLLHNKPLYKGGEDLVSFYMTPGFYSWDPSITVFFSFAVFFAMILSDAGYATLLAFVIFLFWKRMDKTIEGKKFRIILLTLSLFSIFWGVLVGSYFGLTPSPQSLLSHFKLFDLNNYSFMMRFAILIGASHIILANLVQAWVLRKSTTSLANIGWILVILGGLIAFMVTKMGFILVASGLLLVLFFTSSEKPFWMRLFRGFIGLTKVSSLFGDILSYLRLYALGLASSSLAIAFNGLANNVYHSLPAFKVLFALLIILIGHALNFGLCMMSGFIHGLRLNYIEFFNWGLQEEGKPFQAFSKKEKKTWNH